MFSLLKKELNTFLQSAIGYIVMTVFLVVMSFFLWIDEGDSNLLTAGYATIQPFFSISPWIFMFLIPAITMRSFAEEKRTGTIELLFTRPISDFSIIFTKYLAGILLVIVALLPTLIYYLSIYQLGKPIGNIDSGEVVGSYLGLLFLASVFVSIGIFASSITNDQIVAFVVAVFLCFVMYIGLESFSKLVGFKGLDFILINIGINEHYMSLSRGVIDTRDVFYFVAVTGIFLLLTELKLKSRMW